MRYRQTDCAVQQCILGWEMLFLKLCRCLGVRKGSVHHLKLPIEKDESMFFSLGLTRSNANVQVNRMKRDVFSIQIETIKIHAL